MKCPICGMVMYVEQSILPPNDHVFKFWKCERARHRGADTGFWPIWGTKHYCRGFRQYYNEITNMTTFSHSGCAGDIIWHLPAMINLSGGRFKLFLKVNTPSPLLDHPCGPVLLDKAMAESLMTLLTTQPYIESVAIWNGEEVDYDMDMFRFQNVDLRMVPVGLMPTLAFSCRPNLSEPWLFVESGLEPEGILVNRTRRYRNPAVKHSTAGKFVGMKDENDLSIPWLETPTILELARRIQGCDFFVGNQSLAFAIASALDKPRILEVCPTCPNVLGGSNVYYVWNQHQYHNAMTRMVANLTDFE